MKPNDTTPLNSAYSPAEIDELLGRIADSGELGRSRTYGRLLRYLADCSMAGTVPKELEIAVEALGRPADFDVTSDSSVRVYMHQLRKKLDRFYTRSRHQDPYRLIIPKGQYSLVAVPADSVSSASPEAGPEGRRQRLLIPLLLIASLLLAGNLGYGIYRLGWQDAGSAAQTPLAETVLWSPLFSDRLPILLVMGDYYIFAELDEVGNVSRMVRDFEINSERDLESLFTLNPELVWRYSDLDLTYLPEGSAFALNRVLPLLHTSGKPVNVKMASALTTEDIQANHIVYVGYISALGPLKNWVFAGSSLRVGENYDQLEMRNGDRAFTSDAGLPDPSRPFVDYGLVSTIPATSANRIIVIAGMRDAGLTQVAASAVNREELESLSDHLTGDGDQAAFEALYEVKGIDRTNFASTLVYSHLLDTDRILGDGLTETLQ